MEEYNDELWIDKQLDHETGEWSVMINKTMKLACELKQNHVDPSCWDKVSNRWVIRCWG